MAQAATPIKSEVQKLLAHDAAPGDAYGISVAVDGDAALVGAKWEDDNGISSGAIYVYTCCRRAFPKSTLVDKLTCKR